MLRTETNNETHSKGRKALEEIRNSISEEQVNALERALNLASELTEYNRSTTCSIQGGGEIIGFHLQEFVNGVSRDECRNLVRYIIFKTHRYLQNELFFRVICPLIKTYASLPENLYDQRNECVIRVCKEIINNTESLRYTENYVEGE